MNEYPLIPPTKIQIFDILNTARDQGRAVAETKMQNNPFVDWSQVRAILDACEKEPTP